ncbi:vegetative cell wall protein gp1-like [Peromyscus leucopus]|uniref:vegetative cell wall protein gp1-like n=1 Tax=Peromyscus leucopus TaxID=10041 RepID=UPI001884E962|nr:vegetative cell wall protein gp1-like [Peromyscus leucopus]
MAPFTYLHVLFPPPGKPFFPLWICQLRLGLPREKSHPSPPIGPVAPVSPSHSAATAPWVTTITTHSHCDCPTLPVAPRADTVPGPPAHHPLPDPAPSHQGLPSTGLTPLTLVPTNAPKNSACQGPPRHGALGTARDRTGPGHGEGKTCSILPSRAQAMLMRMKRGDPGDEKAGGRKEEGAREEGDDDGAVGPRSPRGAESEG